MNLVTSNYNSLGKVGPHYERPEYRPPARNEAENGRISQRSPSDRQTLSTKNTDVPVKKAAAVAPTGKTTLETARQLTAATSDLIKSLPPLSTTHEPHTKVTTSLMTPVYA
ncbi:hypothetical protein LJB86_00020 [Deltaproteobacteria bacterium OttesenSCG-928-M10]|nr:hypothetical protein [Deltaproteobacteria bacterium OttesenSCG-928-M10]